MRLKRVNSQKNNRLWAAIRRRFPAVQTQNQAAQILSIKQYELSSMLNLTYWPYDRPQTTAKLFVKTSGGWNETAKHLSAVLGEEPEYLFDPSIYGQPPLKDLADGTSQMTSGQLAGLGLLQIIPTPDDVMISRELAQTIQKALARLTDQQSRVLRLRLGFDGEERTLEDTGILLGYSRERIRQIEVRALRRLRWLVYRGEFEELRSFHQEIA